ncbi:MAG: GNAT family protein [Thermomicrobiales bacterium]
MSERADAPIINFQGDLVGLGPIRREYIPLYQRWMNDFETTRYLEIQPRPMTVEQESGWFDQASTGEAIIFTIYEVSTGQPIGNCDIQNLSLRNRRAEVGIVIGEPDARGKGYGTEAMCLLADYAFNVLNLHSLMLWTYEYNVAGQRCYAKVGFREVGRRRASRWFAGRYWDDVAMDLLASEFKSPVLRALLDPEGTRRT